MREALAGTDVSDMPSFKQTSVAELQAEVKHYLLDNNRGIVDALNSMASGSTYVAHLVDVSNFLGFAMLTQDLDILESIRLMYHVLHNRKAFVNKPELTDFFISAARLRAPLNHSLSL